MADPFPPRPLAIGPTRRTLLTATLLAMPWPARAALAATPAEQLARLEARSRGRLGVAIVDTASDRSVGWRLDERFGLCSTSKLLLAAMALDRAEDGTLRLDQVITYDPARLPPYAPVTGAHHAMRIDEICVAALTVSDNGAANLLFDRLGGPAAVTAWLRRIGDATTRSDRLETALNAVPPGEVRDTTTPRAMATTMQALLLGPVLGAQSRERLADWMIGCQTGTNRLRAGLPSGWRIGDKTGTGDDGIGDVAIGYSPDRAPLIVTAYLDSKLPRRDAEAILAEVGRIAGAVTF